MNIEEKIIQVSLDVLDATEQFVIFCKKQGLTKSEAFEILKVYHISIDNVDTIWGEE